MLKVAFPAALAAVLSTSALLLPSAARAQSTYGSAAILTNRGCVQPAGTACILGPRTFTQFAGGMSTGFTTSASNINGQGAFAAGEVEFGAGYLPILHAGSSAGGLTRTGGNITAFRSFTYAGAQSINLALNGALDFTSSGNTSFSDNAGEGYIGVILSIVPLSSLAVLSANATAQEIVNSTIPFMDCSTGAIASVAYSSVGVAAGAQVANLSLSQTCGGGAILLNPGDSFVVVTTVQAISNRLGFADAMNTFKVQYDGVKTVFANSGQSTGSAFLEAAIDGAVPEPATWAMSLAGFAMVGAALRRGRAGRSGMRMA